MKYKIQLVNVFGEIVDESASPLPAEEAIRLINAYESVVSRPTQRPPDGAVCPAHQTYFENDGTCAIVGCKETRPAGNANPLGGSPANEVNYE